MHSYMRSKRGESVSLGYCPLDLFSGDRERIATAIRSLWNAWSESNGTVNNLKIFVKGKTILPADVCCAVLKAMRVLTFYSHHLYSRMMRGLLKPRQTFVKSS